MDHMRQSARNVQMQIAQATHQLGLVALDLPLDTEAQLELRACMHDLTRNKERIAKALKMSGWPE
jgi:hypothetical protein